jgi:hypothetical protein
MGAFAAAQEHNYTVRSGADFIRTVEMINASQTPGTYRITLAADISASTVSFPASDVEKTVILQGDGNRRTITNTADASLFDVENGNTLVLEGNLTLNGGGKVGGVVGVYGGELVMKDGSHITEGGGGAVDVQMWFTKGGTFDDGPFVDGIFTMSGGTISKNTKSGSGAGVYVGRGAGVHVGRGGVFTMSGGTISGNTAGSNGGGVYVYGGVFTMSGGTISGNTAASGGGVYVDSGGRFIKTGGTIYGSDADADLKNSASGGTGHAVDGRRRRNTTTAPILILDSSGGMEGWE